MLVNIMSLSGKHHKKGPLMQGGSAKGPFFGVYRLLYILDMTAFFITMNDLNMNKKGTFYAYSSAYKKDSV